MKVVHMLKFAMKMGVRRVLKNNVYRLDQTAKNFRELSRVANI